MFICIKQNLVNIRSSIHEKLKHWGWAKKTIAYKMIFHFDFINIFFIIFSLRFLNVFFPA